jgi:hypothetical protein
MAGLMIRGLPKVHDPAAQDLKILTCQVFCDEELAIQLGGSLLSL